MTRAASVIANFETMRKALETAFKAKDVALEESFLTKSILVLDEIDAEAEKDPQLKTAIAAERKKFEQFLEQEKLQYAKDAKKPYVFTKPKNEDEIAGDEAGKKKAEEAKHLFTGKPETAAEKAKREADEKKDKKPLDVGSLIGGLVGAVMGWLLGNMAGGGGIMGTLIGLGLTAGGVYMGKEAFGNTINGWLGRPTKKHNPKPELNLSQQKQLTATAPDVKAGHEQEKVSTAAASNAIDSAETKALIDRAYEQGYLGITGSYKVAEVNNSAVSPNIGLKQSGLSTPVRQ